MGKVSVIIYLLVAVLILFLISHSPNKSSNHRHRRLKLRSNFSFPARTAAADHHHHDHIPFDPVVADIEQVRADREWERIYFEQTHKEVILKAPPAESQPEWEDFMDAEDYLNDEEKFNVTDRLIVLFPKIDVDPVDGYVSEHELTEWNINQGQREVMHRTEREMEIHDKNRDGFVSFTEYEPPSWVHGLDNSSGSEVGWWRKDHFDASDVDSNGLLNITEFNDFMHPADTTSPKLLSWLCKEEIRERDSDKNGKVDFQEFYHGLFHMLRNYDDESHTNTNLSSDSSDSPAAKKFFDELDKDGDRFLSAEELLPIIGKLHPSERYYAKQQAEYTISQADADKDGRLSLSEMIENPYVFYSAIFNDDEDDDYENHDEFR
jgi:Ca2+-binding EF-hand superfamily protein